MTWCLLFALLGCPKAAPAPSTTTSTQVQASAAAALFERSWAATLAAEPDLAARLGEVGEGRWTDHTPEAEAASVARHRAELAEAQALDRSILTPEERTSLDLFERELQARIDRARWRDHDYLVNQMHGEHRHVVQLLNTVHPVAGDDLEPWLRRLETSDEPIDTLIAGLERARARGILPPAFVYPLVLGDCRNQIAGIDDGTHSLLQRLKRERPDAPEAFDRAQRALQQVFRPAMERLTTAIELDQAAATEDDGIWKLPEGDALYAFRLRDVTTLADADPKAIHAIGLREVARIHAQLDELREEVGFQGDLQGFFEHLRTDDRYFLPDTTEGREAYLQQAQSALDTMQGRLPELFHTFPAAPLEVRAVEAWREKSAGKGFYQRGTPDGSRPGYFYVNLSDMRQVPTYQLKALAFHEGLPGHHLQLSIAQELTDIPVFRRHARYTAWSEGWGLYSERLGSDLELYTTPYERAGQLAMELWRACRLVVDTGIHDQRWTRQQAIDYLVQNTPNSESDATKAIERYIVMPGQATAYMVGLLEILELRERYLAAGGDLRDFHDLVLRNGPVPLELLRKNTDDAIRSLSTGPNRD